LNESNRSQGAIEGNAKGRTLSDKQARLFVEVEKSGNELNGDDVSRVERDLSSGGVTESVRWLSSLFSPMASPMPAPNLAEESRITTVTESSSIHPSESISQQSASVQPSPSIVMHLSQEASEHGVYAPVTASV
jgi:hypothetical protein